MAADLFVVERSGSIPGAALTLRVSDDGRVRCNHGAPRRLSDDQLLSARELERDLEDAVGRGLRLPPGPSSVLSYRVRLASGTVAFSDTSRGLRPQLARVEAFTRSVARQVCRLAR